MDKILAFALAAAVYPTLLAVVILILTRPHPIRLFTGFLIGGMAMSVTVGLIILGFADTSNLDTSSSSSPSPWIDIGLGVALLAIAATLRAGRDLPGSERRARRKVAHQERDAKKEAEAEAAGKKPKESSVKRLMAKDSLVLAMVLGVCLSLPSVWYLAALKEIDDGGYSTIESIALVLAFNLIMFTLIEIPLALFLLRPDRAAAAVARFDAWTRSHTRQIAIGVCAVAGAYLLISGIISVI